MAKPPSWNQIRKDAAAFAARWADETDEAAEAQSFWTEFLALFGVDRKRVAVFEKRAERLSTGGRGRIDVFWPGVLIAEHKSAGKDLNAAEEQALDYLDSIDQDSFPGLLVVSDFARMRVTDLGGDRIAYEFPLQDLVTEIDRFGYLAGYSGRQLEQAREHEVDIAAARLMGSLYESISKTGFTEHETSVFLVRMLFTLFGDDTGLWEKSLFLEFLETRTQPDGSDLGPQLALLFQTLDRPEDGRAPTLDELLARFPYVNGGLFADRLDIPSFNGDIRQVLIDCCHIDWGSIVPAIFGSLFQSVKSKEDRRLLGEHYTSEENILKVIGPLFLDDLRANYEKSFNDVKKLQRLRDRLGVMKFLDPACGCGNFLVIAYREMRQLELDILGRLVDLTGQSQLALDATLGLRVSPSQFYGIEYEEWPARIAETAMFLIDHQANQVLARRFGQAPDRLPISTNATIVQANALRTSWSDVVRGFDSNTMVMGNPPFLGHAMRDASQHEDMELVWGGIKNAGALDYASCWFKQAAETLDGTGARAAFVSTNSLSQGEQPAVMWRYLYGKDFHIDFAHRSFNWTNEARGTAAVHVVIIGFSQGVKPSFKRLWVYDNIHKPGIETQVPVINAYLADAQEVLVTGRRSPISPSVQPMLFGSMANDGGNLIVSAEDAERLTTSDAVAAQYLRPFLGAAELIQGKTRYCLWLVDAKPGDLRSSPFIRERLAAVRAVRESSNRAATQKLAAAPALFGENRQPTTIYMMVPRVSSSTRKYIPIALFDPSVIASDAALTVAQASLETFGILASRVFTAWNETVSGRLKSDFRVSAEVTYNNFPFPAPSEEQRTAIERAAQGVLDARAAHPDSTLADLYDPLSMPRDLLDAHRVLDRAVLAAYGLPSDSDSTTILGHLFRLYEQLSKADELTFDTKGPRKRTRKG